MQKNLLAVDASVNLTLGVLLLAYPGWLVTALGLPPVTNTFFPNVLGGVLFGIGIALLLAWRGDAHGLGLDGAIAINLCGAGVVVGWLVLAPQSIPPRGHITLWATALIVIAIGLAELWQRFTNR